MQACLGAILAHQCDKTCFRCTRGNSGGAPGRVFHDRSLQKQLKLRGGRFQELLDPFIRNDSPERRRERFVDLIRIRTVKHDRNSAPSLSYARDQAILIHGKPIRPDPDHRRFLALRAGQLRGRRVWIVYAPNLQPPAGAPSVNLCDGKRFTSHDVYYFAACGHRIPSYQKYISARFRARFRNHQFTIVSGQVKTESV